MASRNQRSHLLIIMMYPLPSCCALPSKFRPKVLLSISCDERQRGARPIRGERGELPEHDVLWPECYSNTSDPVLQPEERDPKNVTPDDAPRIRTIPHNICTVRVISYRFLDLQASSCDASLWSRRQASFFRPLLLRLLSDSYLRRTFVCPALCPLCCCFSSGHEAPPAGFSEIGSIIHRWLRLVCSLPLPPPPPLVRFLNTASGVPGGGRGLGGGAGSDRSR